MNTNLPHQLKIDSPIPEVSGNSDYDAFRAELIDTDDILVRSGIEQEVIDYFLQTIQARREEQRAEQGKWPRPMTPHEVARITDNTRTLFRASLLRKRTGESLRVCCRTVAESPVRQWFCGINRFVEAEIFSKSTLGNFENQLPADLLHQINSKLLRAGVSDVDSCNSHNGLDLPEPVSFSTWYVDSTCMKANIHYPVDWVLLVDIARTLMLAVDLIRRQGIVNRMPCSPAAFRSRMNKLAIEMSNARRQKDAKKLRKKIFRKIKKLLRTIGRHAERHASLLRKAIRQDTELKHILDINVHQVLQRIETMTDQLEHAIWQAHERIIGHRKVQDKDKILSVYEPDVNVIVRGKAGAEVEFGNPLYIAEQSDGIIVDYRLLKEKSSDARMLSDSLGKMQSITALLPESVAADRGFDSVRIRKKIEANNIVNAVARRSVPEMRKQLQQQQFREHQKRRAQTEGRIAILKGFASNPMRQKGFEHREIHLGISVLSHNLWKLARIRQQQLLQKDRAAA